MKEVLFEELKLKCGATIKNRFFKSAMSEGLGDENFAPKHTLIKLYENWAKGGTGLLVTGNVMVDSTALGEPNNVVIENENNMKLLTDWADAAVHNGAHIWVQLNHPGKQSPKFINKEHNYGNTDVIYFLSGILGTSAYAILAMEFFLVSRPKFIDRAYGMDKIYKFHMVLSLFALLSGYIHSQLKELLGFEDSFQTTLGSACLIIFAAASAFGFIFMINKLFFNIEIVSNIKQFLNKLFNFKYEVKLLLHNLTVLGLIIVLIHSLLAVSAKYNLTLKIVLLIYFIVPLFFYLNRKLFKVYFYKKNKFVVKEIIHECHNVRTLKLVPKNAALFKFNPGQYVYLKLFNSQIPKDIHPFTISSSPTESSYLSVTIKELGDFTSKLKHAKIGDTAYVEGPYGTFSHLSSNNNKLCFIAGGIGITPFLSMLCYIHDTNSSLEVVLLWGVRNSSELIRFEELKAQAAQMKNFKLVPVVSNEPDFNGEKGYIDDNLIAKYVSDPLSYDFYICGPPVMLNLELNNLKTLKVPKENIHYEGFSN